MRNSLRADVREEKGAEIDHPATQVDEVPILPKRFFIIPQEGICMHWLDDDRFKPERGVRAKK